MRINSQIMVCGLQTGKEQLIHFAINGANCNGFVVYISTVEYQGLELESVYEIYIADISVYRLPIFFIALKFENKRVKWQTFLRVYVGQTCSWNKKSQ